MSIFGIQKIGPWLLFSLVTLMFFENSTAKTVVIERYRSITLPSIKKTGQIDNKHITINPLILP